MTLSPVEQRAHSRIGTLVRGKYRIDGVLGIGGMAVVYKATHRNQAEFAIKMLLPEVSFDADLRARFLREGYAANSVKHRGVVSVVDDDVTEDGVAFLVMELLEGASCDKLWARGRTQMPLEAVTAIGVELLDVLAAAHEKHIVHRDIKPANLFVTRDGTLKVLDFGIARVRDTVTAQGHATITGMLLGTPAFMAPEQALGSPHDVDARADLWAVGATLFALASGAPVHEAETGPQMLVKLATQQPRSLAVVLPDAPLPLVHIVDRALAFHRDQRWPTAGAMRDALLTARRGLYAETPTRGALTRLVTAAGVEALAEQRAASPSHAIARTSETTVLVEKFAGPALPSFGTSQALSADRRTANVPPARRNIRAALGVAALVLAVAAALAVAFTAARRDDVSTNRSTAAGPPAAEPAVSAAQASTAVSPPNSASSNEQAAVLSLDRGNSEAGSAAALVSSTPPHGSPSEMHAVKKVSAPGQPAHSSSNKPSPAPGTPDCNPNYRLDANGEKHFKQECFN